MILSEVTLLRHKIVLVKKSIADGIKTLLEFYDKNVDANDNVAL